MKKNKKRHKEIEEEIPDSLIITGLNRDRQKLLVSRGVPGQDLLGSKDSIDITEYFVRMEPNIPGASNKIISSRKQEKNMRSLFEHPLKGNGAYGISSYPSDARAKYVTQYIMSLAIDHYTANRRKYGTRSLPLWHRVYGSYRDSLRDARSKEDPCMLIISGIHDEASSIKMEKLRDLLEMYSDIPRIVVSGGQPTCDVFSFRLNFPLTSGFYIGPPNLVKEQELDAK